MTNVRVEDGVVWKTITDVNWKTTLSPQKLGYGIDSFEKESRDLKYPYFWWNGRIYETGLKYPVEIGRASIFNMSEENDFSNLIDIAREKISVNGDWMSIKTRRPTWRNTLFPHFENMSFIPHENATSKISRENFRENAKKLEYPYFWWNEYTYETQSERLLVKTDKYSQDLLEFV